MPILSKSNFHRKGAKGAEQPVFAPCRREASKGQSPKMKNYQVDLSLYLSAFRSFSGKQKKSTFAFLASPR
jgi:hypothetical protein